jgi:hypothetical protein
MGYSNNNQSNGTKTQAILPQLVPKGTEAFLPLAAVVSGLNAR